MFGQHRVLRTEFDKLARRLKRTHDGTEKDKLLAAMARLCGAARQLILSPPVRNPPRIRWEKYRQVWLQR